MCLSNFFKCVCGRFKYCFIIVLILFLYGNVEYDWFLLSIKNKVDNCVLDKFNVILDCVCCIW